MTQQLITTSDFHLIANAAKDANQNTLVVFDVDEVLFQPKDQVLKAKFQNYIDNFEKIVHNMTHPENEIDHHSLILLSRKVSPVDASFIDLIANLQSNNVKVVALTHCISGEFGHIKSVAAWRLNELKNTGYHFIKSWPDLKEKTLQTTNAENTPVLPFFKEGVLFTNGTPKGLVLEAFLEYAAFAPNKIIFIDDLAVNIASVSEATTRLNIDYVGIEYVAAAELETRPLNEQRAKAQLQNLLASGEWLDDQAMDELIIKTK